MRQLRGIVLGLVGAGLLAGCAGDQGVRTASTAPAPMAPTYRWTQGNAPQAQREALAQWGSVPMRPGDFYWSSTIPEGEAKVVIDLLTQRFYVYRGSALVGMSTISSGKRIRVRVGPFATRDEAEKASTKIKSAGLGSAVYTL